MNDNTSGEETMIENHVPMQNPNAELAEWLNVNGYMLMVLVTTPSGGTIPVVDYIGKQSRDNGWSPAWHCMKIPNRQG